MEDVLLRGSGYIGAIVWEMVELNGRRVVDLTGECKRTASFIPPSAAFLYVAKFT